MSAPAPRVRPTSTPAHSASALTLEIRVERSSGQADDEWLLDCDTAQGLATELVRRIQAETDSGAVLAWWTFHERPA